jgi:hypothetical protein
MGFWRRRGDTVMNNDVPKWVVWLLALILAWMLVSSIYVAFHFIVKYW